MTPRFPITCVLSLAALCAVPALAQMDPAHPPLQAQHTLSVQEREAVLDAIATDFPKTYVFPAKTAAIMASFSAHRQAGRYAVFDPGVLAERVTEDLREASGDRHVYMLYDPEQYAAALHDAAGAGDANGGETTDALELRRATRDHHGLVELKIFPGNVRYLKVAEFQWTNDVTGAFYDDAARFLKDGDAVIIDVRGNPGGSHAAVRYLVSHFMDPDVAEMNFLVAGKPDEQSRTLEYLPAGRMKGKPLYVLVDRDTGSAAEAFAYDVQQFKLGTVVGATTGGAANNNDFTPIAPGFMLSIPFGRPEHVVSHTNWEGVGVKPDVEVAPAQALDQAQMLALTKLTSTTGLPPEQRADYEWALAWLQAMLHPVHLTDAQLQAYTGKYDKNDVKLENHALVFTSFTGRVRHLVPLNTSGLFGVDADHPLRVSFDTDTLKLWFKGDPSPRVYVRS